MNMVSTTLLSDRYVIPRIQTFNKNNTRPKFQSEHTNGLLQVIINGTGIKQAQNNFNRLSKGFKGDKHKNHLNICSIQC